MKNLGETLGGGGQNDCHPNQRETSSLSSTHTHKSTDTRARTELKAISLSRPRIRPLPVAGHIPSSFHTRNYLIPSFLHHACSKWLSTRQKEKAKKKTQKRKHEQRSNQKFCKFRLSVPSLRLCFPDSHCRCHFLKPPGVFPCLPFPGLVCVI